MRVDRVVCVKLSCGKWLRLSVGFAVDFGSMATAELTVDFCKDMIVKNRGFENENKATKTDKDIS